VSLNQAARVAIKIGTSPKPHYNDLKMKEENQNRLQIGINFLSIYLQ